MISMPGCRFAVLAAAVAVCSGRGGVFGGGDADEEGDPGRDAPKNEPYPFDPCGSHGALRGSRCVCSDVCSGSHCSHGRSITDGATVQGFNIETCSDCACLPKRGPDTLPEPSCATGAEPSDTVLVVCCDDHKEEAGEIEMLDIQSLEYEAHWSDDFPFCSVLVTRSYGYIHERPEVSFLGYIIANYETLPTTMLFAHHENEWHDQVDKAILLSEHALASVSESKPFLPFPSPVAHSHSHEDTEAMIAKIEGLRELKPKEKHHCCSQFMVHKTAVLKHPKELYLELKAMAWNNRLGGAALEQLWQILFSPEVDTDEEWTTYWETLDATVQKWRMKAYESKCTKWGCSCQGFSDMFGASPGAMGGVTPEEDWWWKTGAYSKYPVYILDANDHSRTQRWSLRSARGRMKHGVGSCYTTPVQNVVRTLPPKRAALSNATADLPHQHIPRIVWQTHYTDQIPAVGQYIFDLRDRNPEYEFRLVSDKEADAFMMQFPITRVKQAYFSINPSLGASRADMWRYAVLYQHGGVYIDIDSTCDPLREIIQPEDTALLSWAGKWHRQFCAIERELDQWVMMFAPGHPFLKRALLLGAARVLNPDNLGRTIQNMHQHVLDTTGPVMFKDSVEFVLREQPSVKHRILDEDYHNMCNWKVLGWRNKALDVTKDKSSEQVDYKDAHGQIYARSGIWKRQTKADRPSRDSKNDRKDRKAALEKLVGMKLRKE